LGEKLKKQPTIPPKMFLANQKIYSEGEKPMKFRIALSSIDEALKQLASHPRMTVSPMDYRSETGQPIVIEVILDLSQSTEEFHAELVDSFNTIIMPSIREASRRYRGAIRLHCLIFSRGIIPAWYGFRTLEELDPNPLKQSLLGRKSLRGKTALYKAMRTGIVWTAAAMEHMRENGRGEVPKGKIIVLTDGANNAYPKKEASVVKTLDSISKLNQRNLQLMIGFLNTNEGLTAEAFETVAEETGFKNFGFIELTKGVSLEERRTSFRHQMRYF
jgi:hypothetical protein